MPIPQSSADYYRRQQRIIVSLLLALRRTWRTGMRPSGRWEEQYHAGVGAQLTMLLSAAQVAVTRDADTYIADVLNELGFGPRTEPGVLVATGFAGLAGDGRPVDTLLLQSVTRAGMAYNRRLERQPTESLAGEPPAGIAAAVAESLEREREAEALDTSARMQANAAEGALAEAERWMSQIAATVLIDTARAAESAATTSRRWVGGYVRMLNPPSCSRCVVLAGKFYRWNAGFERHPGCDCRHIPISEDQADDVRTHPDQYFDSLSRNEQDRAFTKAGAQAIRDGADIGQVVNARRGMRSAQVYGHDVLVTTEGTTRRGLAYDALARRGGTVRNREELATRLTRNGPELRRVNRERARAPRLMPESIYEVASDRADAVRLLKAHGYIH